MYKNSVTNSLHLYGQHWPHHEAWVVGNREGLTALRDALDAALRANEATALTATVADGEGYRILIVPATDTDLEQIMLPYSGETDLGGRSPYETIGTTLYRKLMECPESKS